MSIQDKIRAERTKESKETVKRFMNDTRSEELLVVILKAHLYIERELIKALTETILDEKILVATTFRQKLDLANSMGLIDGIYGALGKVNSIRNAYAHDMAYAFDETIYNDLLSTLTKDDKDAFLAEYEDSKAVYYDGTIPELNFKLQMLLNFIWFALASCRVYAKTAIELRLKEKELEIAAKYTEAEASV